MIQEHGFVISVQVIHVKCVCGGDCETFEGSTEIGFMDTVVYCGFCQMRFEVPMSAFERKEVKV